jgi:hypothetical protein
MPIFSSDTELIGEQIALRPFIDLVRMQALFIVTSSCIKTVL